ncbi:hypothetical protein HAX54_050548, partial [Datura stramonium]|nr:hypothetical protein [Datura stramonium]
YQRRNRQVHHGEALATIASLLQGKWTAAANNGRQNAYFKLEFRDFHPIFRRLDVVNKLLVVNSYRKFGKMRISSKVELLPRAVPLQRYNSSCGMTAVAV